MSKETLEWLNHNTLIGFSGKRGTAWHYRASKQDGEPNHYPGPVPVADVKRRLFFWEPAEGTVETTIVTADGVTRITDPTRKAIVRPDTSEILGVFKQGFRVHEYRRWLVANIETVLDDQVSIGSAGLLKGGALAWVQVEVPESCSTPEGVQFRPFLSAATSLDGSMSTTYQTGAQLIVCDNTLSAALGETQARRLKIKHSSRSLGRIAEVRDALGVIHQVAGDFAAQVTRLCGTSVSDAQWRAFLDAHAPLPGEPGRSRTLAEHKRGILTRLWHHDTRVAPWHGSAFGVIQTVNTFTHHEQAVRGAERAERNMLRAVTGGVDDLDHATLQTLAGVLDRPLTTQAA